MGNDRLTFERSRSKHNSINGITMLRSFFTFTSIERVFGKGDCGHWRRLINAKWKPCIAKILPNRSTFLHHLFLRVLRRCSGSLTKRFLNLTLYQDTCQHPSCINLPQRVVNFIGSRISLACTQLSIDGIMERYIFINCHTRRVEKYF